MLTKSSECKANQNKFPSNFKKVKKDPFISDYTGYLDTHGN